MYPVFRTGAQCQVRYITHTTLKPKELGSRPRLTVERKLWTYESSIKKINSAFLLTDDQELDEVSPSTNDIYGSGSTKQASKTPATVSNVEVEEELQNLESNTLPVAAATMSNANGRPVSRARPVSRISLHHGHIDAAVEYEMNKYKDDYSEDAMEKRAKVIKSVPATLDRRRSIRWVFGEKSEVLTWHWQISN